jgi:outer membrane phospholipase A
MFLVVLFDKIVLASLFHWFTDLEKHSNEAKLQFSFSLKLALGLFFTTALMTLAV